MWWREVDIAPGGGRSVIESEPYNTAWPQDFCHLAEGSFLIGCSEMFKNRTANDSVKAVGPHSPEVTHVADPRL
jgi:hypothetical protein